VSQWFVLRSALWHTQQHQQLQTPLCVNLNTLLVRINMEVAEITEYDGALVDFDQEEEAAGVIYMALSTENGIFRFTNLIPNNFMDIYQTMLPFIREFVGQSVSLP
jgi:hypothetical protein